jgi:hypothetical protein
MIGAGPGGTDGIGVGAPGDRRQFVGSSRGSCAATAAASVALPAVRTAINGRPVEP